MQLLWTGGWGDAKWVSAWSTPIAPSPSVCLTPHKTKARSPFFDDTQRIRVLQPCSKHTHALNKIQTPASTQDNLNFQHQKLPSPPSPAPTGGDGINEFMGRYEKIIQIKQPAAHKTTHPQWHRTPSYARETKALQPLWSNQAMAPTLAKHHGWAINQKT